MRVLFLPSRLSALAVLFCCTKMMFPSGSQFSYFDPLAPPTPFPGPPHDSLGEPRSGSTLEGLDESMTMTLPCGEYPPLSSLAVSSIWYVFMSSYRTYVLALRVWKSTFLRGQIESVVGADVGGSCGRHHVYSSEATAPVRSIRTRSCVTPTPEAPNSVRILPFEPPFGIVRFTRGKPGRVNCKRETDLVR
jgi:hypothetical protein